MPRSLVHETPPAVLDASPGASTPLLLEMARRQVRRRRAADLLAQRERDGFVQPSAVGLRTLHRLDGLALDAARTYDAIQLAPVAPLGVCSVVAPGSQDRILSAVRGVEVVSDPTNVMALECARRLAKAPREPVRLCTVHQTLRAQPLPPVPGFSRHFRLFALVEAGPGLPDEGFEVEAVVRALNVLHQLMDACERELGASFPGRRISILSGESRRTIARRLADAVPRSLPGVELEMGDLESGYYGGLRVLSGARDVDGAHVPIGDVGLFDWVARLTANDRMRLVAAGFGLQLVPLRFAR